VQEVEYILWFRKSGTRKDVTDDLRKQSALTPEEFKSYGMQIWAVPPAMGKNKFGHPAPFPLEIPHRCIKLASFIGDIILDPFCGSGTTCVAAKNAGRQYIGIDLEQKYCDIAESRLLETNLSHQTN
jgi:site-specific DNA-methyltransferase (adenine-specific)